MSVLGACWRRPILGRIKKFLKESKKSQKIREQARNRGKSMPGIKEKYRQK